MQKIEKCEVCPRDAVKVDLTNHCFCEYHESKDLIYSIEDKKVPHTQELPKDVEERFKDFFYEATKYLHRDGKPVVKGVMYASLYNALEDFWYQELQSAKQEAYEQGKYEGKNEYYFESPQHLAEDAHSLACTIAQRINQDNFNQSVQSFKKEMKMNANKLVSVTKKILNMKPVSLPTSETKGTKV